MKAKKNIGTIIASCAILVIAAVLMIVRWCVADFKFCSHPLFLFALVISVGFGVLELVLAVKYKSPFRFMLAAVLFAYAVSYSLADFAKMPWWLIMLIAVVVCGLFVGLSYVLCGNRTEEIALNESPDYKNYEQRRAEREAAEKNEEEKELPKIKSFKDEN